MPIYEHLCSDCGPFETLRPMAESNDPSPCPTCGNESPRVILTAPGLALMDGARRRAHAANEKSAHAPKVARRSGQHKHGPGCGCGSSAEKGAKLKQPRSARGRPWMISH